MLQVAARLKVIDRQNSDLKLYRQDDDGDEVIRGIRHMCIDNATLAAIALEKRLIFFDPAWYKHVFFHQSVVEKLAKADLLGVEFIAAEGYSDFAN
ncbi:hypothetical protein [uncultured Shewanella sp.]|uniref:hypothetical protein n=1 Tax=uncultured Shewanella sp. TaxID=173975 RepID=UPI00260313A4|nr:hypothetical protein [uncultured Shewanella sp.]